MADGGYQLDLGGESVACVRDATDDGDVLGDDRRRRRTWLVRAMALTRAIGVTMFVDGAQPRLPHHRSAARSRGEADAHGERLAAPRCRAGSSPCWPRPGDDGRRRAQPLVVIEAMKMEHTLPRRATARIVRSRVAVGDRVEAGAELVALEAAMTRASRPGPHRRGRPARRPAEREGDRCRRRSRSR